ncbi:hypothetical protein [Sorangium sp. So ce693]|uniref:hypothetical protein n=1 Tax=Sorangium sp. So ce693 TaxID=3133318 RepID=UPI003F600CF2
MIERLPPIPRPGGRNLPAFNLLTPVVACLDVRERSPVINARETVRRRLGRLGLAHSTLVEQFDGLVNLLNQAGMDGAFALDTANDDELGEALDAPPASSVPERQRKHGSTPLLPRDDHDVKVIRLALSATHQRLHNTMTNALLAICRGRGLVVEQGNNPECMFDALIRRYRGTERDLLVEAKTHDAAPFCRMAVGQLLDYRRRLRRRAGVDLAVLFPSDPTESARAFLADIGVKVIWLSTDRKKIEGDVTL